MLWDLQICPRTRFALLLSRKKVKLDEAGQVAFDNDQRDMIAPIVFQLLWPDERTSGILGLILLVYATWLLAALVHCCLISA